MRKNTLILLAFALLMSPMAKAINITRVEPANWWVGMKNHRLQVMVYGPGIGKAKLTMTYPGVKIAEVDKTDNPNYLFIYLDIAAGAKPGNVALHFTAGNEKMVYNYPLWARNRETGALGFNATDVLYLITPDRFANGNTNNDNLDSVVVNRQNPNARHGGDLAGVVQHLDYLKDLGITTIWLNPTQENRIRGGSYHGYAITDYYKMDPRFGTNDEFRDLVRAGHKKGLKMVMDMVFNHCGSSHWWMNDLPTKDWINDSAKFVQTTGNTISAMDIHASKTERDQFLDGWFSRGMPDLNQRNPHLATYLIQNSIWWIEYARIDGIRQDTYSYMDFDFLSRWCKAVYNEYPDFNITGETWYNKSGSPAWWQANSKLDNKNSYLKTSMDFPLTFVCQKGFDTKVESHYLNDIYEEIAQDFLYPDPYGLLIFLDNHDMSRFNREGDTDLKRYKQGLAFLLTMRGIPEIFYGTEIAMTGTKEQGDGRLRKDFPGGWPGDTTNAFTRKGRTPTQNEAWDYLQILLHWRKTSLAVTQGTLVHYTPSRSNVYVYARIKGKHVVLVMLNGTSTDKTIQMKRFSDVTGTYTKGIDVLTGQIFDIRQTVTVPASGELVMDLM